MAQRYLYLEAQREFEQYLRTVPLPNIPQELHDIAAQLRNGGDRATLLKQAHERVATAADFGQTLSRYAHPADDLFTLLRQYDDQLMAYSRTLGARSEELRRGTWPILSWLDRYPPPVGGRSGFTSSPASEVDRDVAALRKAERDMDGAADPADAVERAATAADPIWDAGLMVPTIAWFHDGYYGSLRRSTRRCSKPPPRPTSPCRPARALIAGAATALMLALMLAALLLLFLPARLTGRLARRATAAIMTAMNSPSLSQP